MRGSKVRVLDLFSIYFPTFPFGRINENFGQSRYVIYNGIPARPYCERVSDEREKMRENTISDILSYPVINAWYFPNSKRNFIVNPAKTLMCSC
jgi:hypothetical protein